MEFSHFLSSYFPDPSYGGRRESHRRRRRELEHRDLVRRAEPHGRPPRPGAGGDVEHHAADVEAAGNVGEPAFHVPVERHDLPVVGMSAEHQVDAGARRVLHSVRTVIHEDREWIPTTLSGSDPIEHAYDLVPRLGVVDADDA